MRSIRLTFILLEGLTLAIAVLFSILLLFALQNEIKERYISTQVISIETINLMVENFLNDNTGAFEHFTIMADKERASMLIPAFSDIYYCNSRMHIGVIIRREENSHIFTGYDLGRSKVGRFLAGLKNDGLHQSPMYRSPENDGLSVYIIKRSGGEFIVGRIGMEKFREHLARMARYTNSIITFATKDGYILFSTDKSMHLNMLPDRANGELEMAGQNYLCTQKLSIILDNYIAIFTPLSTVYGIVRFVQLSTIIFMAVIFMVIVAKIFWQSVMIIRPLGRLSAILGAWNFNRIGEEVPRQFIAYEEISLLYDSFNEKSVQINDAVQALRESEEKFRTTLSAMVDEVFVFDREGCFVLCHTSGSDDAGVFAGAAVGVTYAGVMPEDTAAKFREAFEANRRGESSAFDFFQDNAAGTGWYSARISPKTINGAYTGSIAVVRDITERKNAEDRALADLREKDVLLKEIHHRVKNNLNVITSLLDLQAHQMEGKDEAIEAFRESRNRILSMALVHEKLYQTKNYTRVNFKEYIEEMTGELLRVYNVGRNVSIEYGIDEVHLDINIAIPCGLILNELVSNAMKHAFTGSAAGKIHIGLRSGAGGALALVVGDNGRGMPPGFDIHSVESLGLKLVNLLGKQIGGRLTIENGQGAKFTISFRV